jgi:hypothetical protein
VEEVVYALDASSYDEAPNEYELVFKNLILNIYSCYEYLLANSVLVPNNNENRIRDILLEYLKNKNIRTEICIISGYIFEKEVDENMGRVDIKIRDANEFIMHEEHAAYYVIECKRLDGSSTLNKAYVADGIERFTTGYKSTSESSYYSSYYGVNGMIGFIVKDINIHDNMSKIGNFFNEIERNKLYESNHANLNLYHLMMDFSDNLA